MDQIEELKYLLAIAKHRKFRKVLEETLDDSISEQQREDEITRLLAISQRLARRENCVSKGDSPCDPLVLPESQGEGSKSNGH